ncbi:unnamed protein product [Cuscuta campestris]|uniref:Reverse transcriptase domain-containing protein n=1 Tax=Cuscuta campestris TaxID=132261 RepID=A0A484MM79_9ASTE|nr:unnamed protein product [Cuscuta campestris]
MATLLKLSIPREELDREIPYPPYIFIIAMEGLTRSLNHLHSLGCLKKYNTGRIQTVNHLTFADDVLIFTNGSLHNLKKLKSFLSGFEEATGAIIPTSAAIGLHFYPIWEAASIAEWLYNGGPYELIVLHFLLGVACYMGREWELSFRLGMRPWIAIAYSAPVAAATAVFLIYPVFLQAINQWVMMLPRMQPSLWYETIIQLIDLPQFGTALAARTETVLYP